MSQISQTSRLFPPCLLSPSHLLLQFSHSTVNLTKLKFPFAEDPFGSIKLLNWKQTPTCATSSYSGISWYKTGFLNSSHILENKREPPTFLRIGKCSYCTVGLTNSGVMQRLSTIWRCVTMTSTRSQFIKICVTGLWLLQAKTDPEEGECVWERDGWQTSLEPHLVMDE